MSVHMGQSRWNTYGKGIFMEKYCSSEHSCENEGQRPYYSAGRLSSVSFVLLEYPRSETHGEGMR